MALTILPVLAVCSVWSELLVNCAADVTPHCSVSRSNPCPAVVPVSKLSKIEPRQTIVASLSTCTSSAQTYLTTAIHNTQSPYLTTVHRNQSPCITTVNNTQPSYLLLATSVGNSIALNSPSNAGMTQTTVAAQVSRSQPSYLIVASSVRNSVGNFVDGFQLNLPPGIPISSCAEMLCNSSVVVSSSSVCCSKSSLSVTPMGSGVNRHLVLQTAGVTSTPPLVATLLLPVTPLEQVVPEQLIPERVVIPECSNPTSTVRYVVPTPVLQPMSLQSPSNSVPAGKIGNSQLNFIQTISSSCMPVGNLRATPVQMSSSLGNTKLTVVELTSSGCLTAGNSQTFVVRSQLGNLLPSVVRQSSSDCLLVGNSQLSGITGIPASTVIEPRSGNSHLPVGNSQLSGITGIPVSTVIQPRSGNSRSDVVQQSPLYYVLMGNSRSSVMQASLVNSTLPQVLMLGDTDSLTNRMCTGTQPQRLCSTSTSFLNTAQ